MGFCFLVAICFMVPACKNDLSGYNCFSMSTSCFQFPQWRCLIFQWNSRCDDVVSINCSIILITDFNGLHLISASGPPKQPMDWPGPQGQQQHTTSWFVEVIHRARSLGGDATVLADYALTTTTTKNNSKHVETCEWQLRCSPWGPRLPLTVCGRQRRWGPARPC